MTTDLNDLRNKIINTACENQNADTAIRAVASALTTMVIGCTDNREAAHAILDRLVKTMRDHINDVARPANVSKQ